MSIRSNWLNVLLELFIVLLIFLSSSFTRYLDGCVNMPNHDWAWFFPFSSINFCFIYFKNHVICTNSNWIFFEWRRTAKQYKYLWDRVGKLWKTLWVMGRTVALQGVKWMLLQGFDKKSEAKWLITVIFIGKQIVIDREESQGDHLKIHCFNLSEIWGWLMKVREVIEFYI